MLLIRLILNALALMVVAALVPGITIDNFYAAIITAIVLGLLNAILKPILTMLTLPITILTMGLFYLLISVLMFWLASTIVKGFVVDGFTAAVLGSLWLWVISLLVHWLFDRRDHQAPPTDPTIRS